MAGEMSLSLSIGGRVRQFHDEPAFVIDNPFLSVFQQDFAKLWAIFVVEHRPLLYYLLLSPFHTIACAEKITLDDRDLLVEFLQLVAINHPELNLDLEEQALQSETRLRKIHGDASGLIRANILWLHRNLFIQCNIIVSVLLMVEFARSRGILIGFYDPDSEEKKQFDFRTYENEKRAMWSLETHVVTRYLLKDLPKYKEIDECELPCSEEYWKSGINVSTSRLDEDAYAFEARCQDPTLLKDYHGDIEPRAILYMLKYFAKFVEALRREEDTNLPETIGNDCKAFYQTLINANLSPVAKLNINALMALVVLALAKRNGGGNSCDVRQVVHHLVVCASRLEGAQGLFATLAIASAALYFGPAPEDKKSKFDSITILSRIYKFKDPKDLQPLLENTSLRLETLRNNAAMWEDLKGAREFCQEVKKNTQRCTQSVEDGVHDDLARQNSARHTPSTEDELNFAWMQPGGDVEMTDAEAVDVEMQETHHALPYDPVRDA